MKRRSKSDVNQSAGSAPVVKTVIITNHVNRDAEIESRFIFTSAVDEERFFQLVQPRFDQAVASRLLITPGRSRFHKGFFSIYWSMPEGRNELAMFSQLEACVLDLLEYSLEWKNLRVERAYSYAEVGELCREYRVNLSV